MQINQYRQDISFECLFIYMVYASFMVFENPGSCLIKAIRHGIHNNHIIHISCVIKVHWIELHASPIYPARCPLPFD